jgi:nucleoside 2-deoxyribosyltransferase
MNLYLAAPLFTQAERSWNLRLAALLSAAGHPVFLPQAEVLAIETLDAETIFRVDVDGVRSADAIVAVLDGPDRLPRRWRRRFARPEAQHGQPDAGPGRLSGREPD